MYARYVPPEHTEEKNPTDFHDDRVGPQKRKRNASNGDRGYSAGQVKSQKKLRKGRINTLEPLLSSNVAGKSEKDKKEEWKRKGQEHLDREKNDSEEQIDDEQYHGSDKRAEYDSEHVHNDLNPSPTITARINPERQRRIEEEERHSSIFSKFQRSSSLARSLAKTSLDDEVTNKVNVSEEESTELYGLTPLPQPEPTAKPSKAPAFSALPPWLANPVVVPATEKLSFECFDISTKLKSLLQAKGYSEAFAIQSALISLLLAGSDQQVGDICVSAATGSGKTLAYVLPIIEKLRDRVVTKLRALIVVPTRELVSQVRDACELCLSGSGLQVGIAVGNRQFSSEQDMLVKREHRYNPQAYEAAVNRSTKLPHGNDYDAAVDDLAAEDVTSILTDHVVEYSSKVDILITTPGRLVDHIRSTPGFTLDDLQWLVIDEADRLLSQSFQEWITITMGILERERSMSDLRMDQRILQMMNHRPISAGVRKIVLSATMTRDVGKLSVLKLRKPKLVVVDHGNLKNLGEETDRPDFLDPSPADESFDLPDFLQESAISVRDESEKPLYLVQLLRMHILERGTTTRDQKEKDEASSGESSENDCAGSSDEGSDDDVSFSGDEPALATLSPIRPSTSGGDHDETSRYQAAQIKRGDESKLVSDSGTSGILIFTKSNESAVRLARLIAILHPNYKDRLGNLTSTQSSSQRRRTLKSFISGTTSLLVASDLVSRGMDIPDLAHVVNYDLPTSIRAYVHRVGRTARAGKGGQAWTLVTDKEARWFWRSVGRGQEIRRAKGRKVRRITIDMAALNDEVRGGYRKALETLGDEVRGDRLQDGAVQDSARSLL